MPLFERTTRHVGLTPAGHEYAERLRALLAQISDLEVSISKNRSSISGSLRVAIPKGLARPFFGPALATFIEAYPGVELVLSDRSGDVHPIRDGFDVVIADGRIVDAELIARRAIRTRDVCVASRQYLDARGTPRHSRDLTGHAALVRDLSRGPVHWPLRQGGLVTVHPVFRCDDHSLLLEAALQHLGIALLPLPSAQPYVSTGTLKVILDGIVGASRDIHVVYSQKAQSNLLRVFVAFVLEFIRNHGAALGVVSDT